MGKAERLTAELRSFQEIWQGGFFAGDPQDPLFGLFGLNSYIGVSHAIYLCCIKPYVTPTTTVLEIGCGRGAWSRLLLHAKALFCVDALSAEHNGFFEYVGKHDHVSYFQVDDFSLSMLADNAVDFVFSYDALCHASLAAIGEYIHSLKRVMRPGAHGIIMVADYEKFNRFFDTLKESNVLNCLASRKRYSILRPIVKVVVDFTTRINTRRFRFRRLSLDEDDLPLPGRWYHAGTSAVCDVLSSNGFEVLDEDMGIDRRSPLIHFGKK